MKITFMTSQPNAPCSEFYINAFKSIENISFFDKNFNNYDIALFMTYDHEIIKSIREKHPDLKIGIIDPRNYKVYGSIKYCDFIIVDSIEMEDFWRVARKPILNYAEYPDISYVEKKHEKKDIITIGYHGNQIHLECMYQKVTPALSELGKKYNIELLIMHNGPRPSGKENWYPQNISVRHIPWSMENYTKELSKSDIGIVPNNLIPNKKIPQKFMENNKFNYSIDDFCLRFKMPSNPGRFIVFGKLNIPVVADFYPSSIQILGQENGYVAHSTHAWYYYLEKLILSHELRQQMGNRLQNLVLEKFDFKVQNQKMISFLKKQI